VGAPLLARGRHVSPSWAPAAGAGEGEAVGVGHEEAPGRELAVLGQLVHAVDGAHAQAAGLALHEQLGRRLPGHPLGQVQLDEVGVLLAAGVRVEQVELGPLRVAHHLLEGPPLGVLHADVLDEAVAGLVDRPRHQGADPDAGGVLAQVGHGGG